MKKVLIINGHPNNESLCTSLANEYIKGAKSNNINVEQINLHSLEFNLNLQHGYQKRTNLEPDLLASWDKIKQADHIVFVYPNWWGTYPALLKGFIDRLFLPGFAYKPKENSFGWDKLLKGKTAHIMVTMDSPAFFYRLFLHSPGHNSMKRSILAFCGVKTVRTTNFRIVKSSTLKKREKWLAKAYKLGTKAA